MNTVQYEWKITGIESVKEYTLEDGTVLNDVVTSVNYVVIASDGEFSSSQKGICPLPTPTAGNFAALADTTEEMAMSWVEESKADANGVVGFHSPQLEARLNAMRLDSVNNTHPKNTALPWA